MTTEPLPDHAQATLETVAALVGFLLRGLHPHDGTPPRGGVDALTGLVGHAAFRDALADAWAEAGADGGPLSVLVIDVDHLADVNARSGHGIGDALLVAVAGRMRGVVAGLGEPARIGGEEFAVILPGLDAAAAVAIGDRVRAAVAADPLPGVGAVTVSGGAADSSQAARPGELLRLAEGAVSWAKTHGRDLVLAYDPRVVVAFSAADWAVHLDRDRTLASIEALARAVDARDTRTQEHSDRVARLAAALAEALGWAPDRVELLREAALVHDVGKVAIPDSVLHKPCPLTEAEWARMRMHSDRGADIVRGVLTGEQVAWVLHHHERWDGAGYPGGLARDDIPEGARIIAIADAMDAISSTRPYRAARSRTEALAEVRRARGTQLWPRGVEMFLDMHAGEGDLAEV